MEAVGVEALGGREVGGEGGRDGVGLEEAVVEGAWG